MTETAVGTLYEIVQNALNGRSVWGERVHAGLAPAGEPRPYAIYNYVAGGDEGNRGRLATARIVMSVKCVAANRTDAFAGAAAITALLDDQGEQELAGLPSHPDWHVSTVTQDRVVQLDEMYAGAESIYHQGHQYVFKMEAKS